MLPEQSPSHSARAANECGRSYSTACSNEHVCVCSTRATRSPAKAATATSNRSTPPRQTDVCRQQQPRSATHRSATLDNNHNLNKRALRKEWAQHDYYYDLGLFLWQRKVHVWLFVYYVCEFMYCNPTHIMHTWPGNILLRVLCCKQVGFGENRKRNAKFVELLVVLLLILPVQLLIILSVWIILRKKILYINANYKNSKYNYPNKTTKYWEVYCTSVQIRAYEQRF